MVARVSEAICIKSLNITENSVKNRGNSLHGIALHSEGKGKGLVKISSTFPPPKVFLSENIW